MAGSLLERGVAGAAVGSRGTVDTGIVISGEIVLELDDGVETTLRADAFS
jgi:hypothetical protein